MFTIVAYNKGKINAHAYIVGMAKDIADAMFLAAEEHDLRHAQYGIAIYEPDEPKGVKLLKYIPSIQRERRPYLCSECFAASGLGAAVLEEARRTIGLGGYDDWPQWIREEIDLAMGIAQEAPSRSWADRTQAAA